jgi:hypothetical protein
MCEFIFYVSETLDRSAHEKTHKILRNGGMILHSLEGRERRCDVIKSAAQVAAGEKIGANAESFIHLRSVRMRLVNFPCSHTHIYHPLVAQVYISM